MPDVSIYDLLSDVNALPKCQCDMRLSALFESHLIESLISGMSTTTLMLFQDSGGALRHSGAQVSPAGAVSDSLSGVVELKDCLSRWVHCILFCVHFGPHVLHGVHI